MMQQMQTILEDSMMDQSPESRRDSYAVSPALFSPKTEEWHHVDTGISNNPFFSSAHSSHNTTNNNNPFVQMDQHYQFGMWSGTATPTTNYAGRFDGLSAEYDAGGVSGFSSPETAVMNLGCGVPEGPTPFTNPTNQVPMFRADSQMSHMQDGLVKKRPASPLLRSHNELRRGDGIRKKNARFDIPSERNLNNIDQLIAQSTDEQEIKELKQQKRLLRNRQAALDSRQRKKMHTERLEDEKKHFTEVISTLEEQIQCLQRENDQMTREKSSWDMYLAEVEQKHDLYVTELVSQHTQETGDLRKKISILTNHIAQVEGGRDAGRAGDELMVSSSTATATAFPGTSFFDEMSGLTMDTSVSWDDSEFTNFGDPEPQHPSDVKHEMQLVPATSQKKAASDVLLEKPAQQGGLLFMLFLVGAFVLSKQSTSVVPRVSEDVRVASATILDNVLKDVGLSSGSSASEIEHALAPGPSGVASSGWAASQTLGSAPVASVAGGSLLDTVAPSALGSMADALTQPTQQQTNEDAFSMTAAQYIDLTGQEFLGAPPSRQKDGAPPSTSQGRRNLAEALNTMRSDSSKGSASEVYTRSLLWDQIPSDVVRSFAKMVVECNQAQATP